MASPSHMVLLANPEVKLTVGAAFESTVIVTIFDAADATLVGQDIPLICAYTKRLKAVVVDNADGEKVCPVAPGIFVNALSPVLLCH